MHLLVTGGCGYKGSVLVPKLLAKGHQVTVWDLAWFGKFLSPHPKLTILNKDVRSVASVDLNGIDAIIHLASVANDPCSDLNPKLTWEISALATMQLADSAARSGIKHFIYASSGSVYGIKEEENVTEELTLFPLSEYNKTKMVAERVLLSYASLMTVQIVRPATVCGYSPRMRLDVAVNLLTMQALTKGEMQVFGGSQIRPNIHIDDITDLYCFFLEHPNITGIFNAGFENISILDIAHQVNQTIPAKITLSPSSDLRSYRLNSDKLLATGFKPKKNVASAILEIAEHYQNKTLKDESHCYNLKWMQKLALGG